MHLPSVFYHIGFFEFISSLLLINLSFFKLQYFIATTLGFFFTGVSLKENREIIAIKSLGIPKKYLLRLILNISIFLSIFAVIVSFLIVPTANRERAKFITQSVRNYYMESIQPKNFFKFPGDTVIYIENKSKNRLEDIFLYNKSSGNLITAKTARLKNGLLILENGLIQIPSKDGFSILEFKKYEFKIDIDYKKDYTYDDFRFSRLLRLTYSKSLSEKNKAFSVIFERIGYVIPFMFIGVIAFFIGLSIQKEKEILLAIVVLFIVIYISLNFYLLKLIEKGVLNPIVYIGIIASVLYIMAGYFYKKG